MKSIKKMPIISLTTLGNLKRVYSININDNYVKQYLKKINEISVRDLEYIPYLRFLIAREFEYIFKIKDVLMKILKDYKTGSIIINFNNYCINDDDCIKLSTAISHLLGLPNIDPLSGKYYATFIIEHMEIQLPTLLRPYEIFKMHTDGAYMKKTPDWIFFMKMGEVNVVGGQSRFLHVDDWEDFNYFYNHPDNAKMIKFFSSPYLKAINSHHNNEENNVYESPLNIEHNCKSIKFIDRFMHPMNFGEAEFIFELQNSLENSSAIVEVEIPVGSILVANNHYWLHGRKQFQRNNNLHRKLMRQRGVFSE